MTKNILYGVVFFLTKFSLLSSCLNTVIPLGGDRFGDKFMVLLSCISLEAQYNIKIKAFRNYFDEIIVNNLNLEEIDVSRKYLPLKNFKKWKLDGFKGIRGYGKSLQALKINLEMNKNCRCRKENTSILKFGLAIPKVFSPGERQNSSSCTFLNGPILGDDLKKKFSFLYNLVSADENLSSVISIGVHYREGGTYDDDDTRRRATSKFKPITYYQENILQILNLIRIDLPVTIQFFSDSIKTDFMDEIMEEVLLRDKHDISYSYCSDLERPLEDLSKMSKLDFLVRAGSYFACAAEVIGEYSAVSAWDENYKYFYYNPDRINKVFSRVQKAIQCESNLTIPSEIE